MNHYERLQRCYSLLIQRKETEEAELLRPIIEEIENDKLFFMQDVGKGFVAIIDKTNNKNSCDFYLSYGTGGVCQHCGKLKNEHSL